MPHLRLPEGLSEAEAEAYQHEYEVWVAGEYDRRKTARLSALPLRLRTVYETLRETECVRLVRAWLAGPDTFLILAGSIGIGKSVAAAVAFVEYNAAPGRSLYTKASEYTAHGLYGEKNELFWSEARDAELLIIDDLGTETRDAGGFAASQLEALLDCRYDAIRKTLVTTNYNNADFRARYCQESGARILDRLRESGAFHEFEGESLRRRSP